MNQIWQGIYPAVTTKFDEAGRLAPEAMRRHFGRLLQAGCDGLIVAGSLGEASTLEPEEKLEILALALAVSAELTDGAAPVLLTVADSSTRRACRLAEAGAEAGAQGLMVLPPLLYHSAPAETAAHFRAVAAASDLPIMVYNNPVAYKVDVTLALFEELADEPKFAAIKESSDDVRRITHLRRRLGDRYRLFCGVDNLALEAFHMGAEGWVAGLVTAFPEETVAIWRLHRAGRHEEALAIYRWFAPLLELDVSPRLVQNIKLAEAMTGLGDENVRPPRLPLAGEERARAAAVIEEALASRPALPTL